MKRKSSLKNKGIIVCAVIAVALCVWTSVFSLVGKTDILREAAVLVSSPFTSLFDSAGQGVARAAAALMGPDEMQKAHDEELEHLRQIIAAQELEISRLQQMKQENDQLRSYLSLTESNPTLLYTEARTIYSADTTLRCLTLDKGSRDGIEVGMPVLDTGGLVGVVSEVTLNTCKVKTVLDETLNVGVRDARSGISATLRGTPEGSSYCVMTYMDPSTDFANDLALGDVIVTAGNSELFPAGLIVGRIARLELKEQLPCAYIQPAADLSSATSLLLIVTGEDMTPPEDSTQQEPPTTGDPTGEGDVTDLPTEGEEGENESGDQNAEDIGADKEDTDKDTNEPDKGDSDPVDVPPSGGGEDSNEGSNEGNGFAGEEVPLT